MLPQTLLCLLSAALIVSQSLSQLPLNQVSVISSQNLPNPPIFSLPSGNSLSISLALCSDFQSTNSPTFTLKNSTNSPRTELALSSDGLTTWTGKVTDGATLQIENLGSLNLEIGISDNGEFLVPNDSKSLMFVIRVPGPLHQILPEYTLFGDSTSNQALIFSPVFMNVSLPQPTYPNYSLPQANLSFPDPPPNSQAPTISLIFSPTSSTPSLTQIPQTGCRLNTVTPPADTNSTSRSWLRDEQGWRMQFFVEGLTPATNYTAYIVQSGTQVSGPVYFVTKSCMSFSNMGWEPSDTFQHLSRVS
jgi:calcium channel MID1